MQRSAHESAWLFALLAIALLSGTGASCAQAPKTQRTVEDVTASPTADAQAPGNYALVIGIGKYTNLHPLETPAADATAVAKMLREQYGFQTRVLLDATRTQILDSLVFYRKSLSENSNLLIYYAGHGYLDTTVDEAYWLPVDASADNNNNWISADDITRGVRAIASKHVLVISDSCYSGAILGEDTASHRGLREVGGGLAMEYSAYLAKMQQRISKDWMASGSIEPVADDGAPGHSVFAGALLQGLDEMQDPRFSASDLFYTYVRRKVGGNSQQLPQYGSIRGSGDQLGDFIFTRGSAPSSVATATTPPLGNVQPSDRSSKTPDSKSGREMADRGWNYQHGLSGLPKNEVQAVSWYRKAADAGEGGGMANLGVMYEQGGGGLPKDLAQAVRWYRKAADAGSGVGMSNLGKMYLHGGGGLPKDDVQAEKWCRKAADAGDGRGMMELGFMYSHGLGGLPKDEAQAVSWYRKAVEAGDGHGMSNLGGAYEHGRGGLPKDEAQAVSLYRKAADAGDGHGMTGLGSMYSHGLGGLAKDEAQAVSWYRKAADAGNAHGMANLGRMYENGSGGLPKDEAQAVNWYRKAVEAGDDGAAAELKRLGK